MRHPRGPVMSDYRDSTVFHIIFIYKSQKRVLDCFRNFSYAKVRIKLDTLFHLIHDPEINCQFIYVFYHAILAYI